MTDHLTRLKEQLLTEKLRLLEQLLSNPKTTKRQGVGWLRQYWSACDQLRALGVTPRGRFIASLETQQQFLEFAEAEITKLDEGKELEDRARRSTPAQSA